MRRVAAPILLAAASFLARMPHAAADTRVAVVDVQHAVMQTEDGRNAQGTLKKLFDKRQQDLDAKQAELGRVREDIERQSRVVSKEALARRMEDWQRRMIELQTVYVDYNKELQKKQGELTGPIIKKMIGIIGRIARKNGYEMIIDKQTVPYVRPDLDLTDQIVQLYNSGDTGDAPAEEKKEGK